MPAGRKSKREAGVQKGERGQRNGDRRVGNARRQEEQERPACKKVREGKEMGTGEWEMPAGRKGAREKPAYKKEREQRGRAKRVRFPFCAISIVALRLKIMV